MCRQRNRVLRPLAALGAALLLAGCASQPVMDRDEFLSVTGRTYAGVTEEAFYEAAKELFKLSDPTDVKFVYPNSHSMVVQHKWMIYMVLAFSNGQNIWRINTEPTEDGLVARAYVSQINGGAYGAPTGGGGAYANYMSAPPDAVVTPAVYGLFWGRMDYLLGKSAQWATCSQWRANVDRGETYGDLGALCGFPIADRAPVQASR